jgi:hypothetical protein
MMKPLEYVLDEMNEQEEEIAKQPFLVTDLDSAAEAQRRITYFNERMTEIDEITEKQIAPFLAKIEKIREWGGQAKREYIDKALNYEVLLESYIRNEITKQVDAGKKPKKSIKLPYGTIALKKQQPEFQKDEVMLLEYAKSEGFVKVKESTDWAELKKKCEVHEGRLIDDNGQVVPGVSVVEREDRFELKLD